MKEKSIFKHFDVIFITFLIVIFFIYRFNQISYGLPFFVNFDEIEFQSSTLSTLSFLTGYFELNYNPYYAPLINLILILKYIFVNEFLINSLNIAQIKSKLYFNPELFLYYGRAASLTITSFSIYFLYLVFKKLKINFLIYSILLITFTTSLVVFNVSTTFGKNATGLLIYLIQLYFFLKYLLKIEKFNLNSYFIFGFLAAFAWGVNYWPAFISIYAVFFLHFEKFKFSKVYYLLIFITIFILFGLTLNSFFVNMGPLDHIKYLDSQEKPIKFEIVYFINHIISRIVISFKIIFFTDKNILLLIAIIPIFLLNKFTRFKKEFFVIFFLIIEPLIIFGISGNMIPQLRYFAGIISVIMILTSLIVNELDKQKLGYFSILLILLNFCFIYLNVQKNIKINKILSNNHSFFSFNKNIEEMGIDKGKILYLVETNSQESLKQNQYYLKLYEKNLIIKNENSKKYLEHIQKKIRKIENTKNIIIENRNLKDNIINFNYSHLEIVNFKLFFDFIKKDFNYIVIETSEPFYLSNHDLQNEIKNYLKGNFIVNYTQFEKNKIFLRSQQSVIHYYANTLNVYDFAENIDNDKLEVIYGANFALYELK